MKLTAFRVHSYRSINDSSRIEVAKRTVLVGRNESGKTSLLKVLAGLKPAGAMPVFTHARDFPRDRPRYEFDKDSTVLESHWGLDPADKQRLAKAWPRCSTVSAVEVTRPYEATRTVRFIGLALDPGPVRSAGDALSSLIGATEALPESVKYAMASLTGILQEEPSETGAKAWAAKVQSAAASLRPHLGAPPNAEAATALAEVERLVGSMAKDDELRAAAEKAVFEAMPVFVYLDEWDSLPGHYDIQAFAERTRISQQNATDRLFAKLLKVAELDANELTTLLSKNHEERKLLTNRASRVISKTLRSLWKDRKLTVEFSLDANHFDVVVSDEETDALVPLDERSRGFRWYFSFFVVFAADTDGGDKENAILLLDEPGLFLHATAQSSLLAFFDTLPNQIIYSTHSPFMIDPKRIESVRTVNLQEGTGTVVSAEPTGDANTLFPLQAALGYDLTQTLFVGSRTVLVEGVTDYWYLSAASDFLRENGLEGLAREIVLTPAGGAPKVPYMLALLTAQNLNVVVLFDSEPKAEATAKSLLKEKLVRAEGLVYIGAAFSEPPSAGADVEDLLDQEVFLGLVLESYGKELAGRTPAWNHSIPRVARRAEKALAELGIEFQKTRPARLFVRKMAEKPAELLPAGAQQRFGALFKAVNAAVDRIVRANRPPFT